MTKTKALNNHTLLKTNCQIDETAISKKTQFLKKQLLVMQMADNFVLPVKT